MKHRRLDLWIAIRSGAWLLCLTGACATHAARVAARTPPQRPEPRARQAQGDIIVSPSRLLAHVALLAHDEMEGRGTGTPGGDLAAGYIAGQFAAAGLAPGGPDGTYFQHFEAERSDRFKSMYTIAEGASKRTRNVLAVLPGMGPHQDEYVVLGAHYDHLGTRNGKVYNGADDNASGVAAVIEAAWTLSAVSYRDRGIIFAAFAAEEIGLLGSAHFVSHPPVPIDSIAAMINMDMIGRLDPQNEMNVLAVHGLDTGVSFREIVGRHADRRGLQFASEPSAMGPSDHQNFYLAGVPAMFFFTGIHEDYHRPGDDIAKINAPGAATVAGLACDVALDLVNHHEAPLFARVDRPARILRGAAPPPGVYMGLEPDWNDDPDQEGCKVVQVLPGTGAEAGGMMTGDLILAVAGTGIQCPHDLRLALDGQEAGNVVQVIVRRDEREVVLHIGLSARP